MALKQSTSVKPMMENNNVAGGRLAMFSKDPPVGFFRDGFCRTAPEDKSNHSIAAIMTSDFLDSTGSDLKDMGIRPGQKWCLCASKWQEAIKAAQDGRLSREGVPKVNLTATHESALKEVSYKDLKAFAAEGELKRSGRQDEHSSPENVGDSLTKSSQQVGDKGPNAQPAPGDRGQNNWGDLNTTAGGGTGVAGGR